MRKNTWLRNLLLLIICGVLTVAFAGFLIWDSKVEAERSEKLMREAKKSDEKEMEDVKDENKDEEKSEKTQEEEQEPQMPVGISFWGDEFFTTENDLQYSSRVKLEER